MARTKAALGSGARLADYLSASLLARVVPPAIVHEVLDVHDCNSQRVRSFPAVAGVYYCMALSLYPEAVHGRPRFAKFSIHDGWEVKIAPVHSDFRCGFWPLSLMGFAGWRLDRLRALWVPRLGRALPTTV